MKKIILLSSLLFCSLMAQSLKMAINETLATNPIILERLSNFNSIKLNISTEQAAYYPKLDLNLGVGIEKLDRTDLKGIFNVYQNSLTYTHNIFNGFQTTYRVKEQEYKTVSAAYSYVEKVNTISFQLVSAYLEVMKNQELLETFIENVSINKEITVKVNKLYNAGLITLSEVNKVESSLSLSRANLVVQENTILDVSYNLKRILGKGLNPTTMNKPILSIVLPESIKEAKIIAIKNNPSIIINEFNIRTTQAMKDGSISVFYPKIDIEISQNMARNVGGFAGQNNRFKAMAFLSFNIFNGFLDSTLIQKSKTQVNQNIEIKNDIKRKVLEQLDIAWSANEKLNEQLIYLTQYKDFSLQTLTLYSKEYGLGNRSLLDLLSAQNDLIKAESQIISTQYNILYAKYRILDSMGLLVQTIIGNTDKLYSNVNISINGEPNANN